MDPLCPLRCRFGEAFRGWGTTGGIRFAPIDGGAHWRVGCCGAQPECITLAPVCSLHGRMQEPGSWVPPRSSPRPCWNSLFRSPARCPSGAPSLRGSAWSRCCWPSSRRAASTARAPCGAAFSSPISRAFSGTWATATGSATPWPSMATCPPSFPYCCCSDTAWSSASTSASSASVLRSSEGPAAAHAGRWPPRRSCGPASSSPPPASPAFPGTSWATRKSTMLWSTSLPPGPASTASASFWSPSMRSSPAACFSTAAPAAARGASPVSSRWL